jgi:hypothetical protein
VHLRLISTRMASPGPQAQAATGSASATAPGSSSPARARGLRVSARVEHNFKLRRPTIHKHPRACVCAFVGRRVLPEPAHWPAGWQPAAHCGTGRLPVLLDTASAS